MRVRYQNQYIAALWACIWAFSVPESLARQVDTIRAHQGVLDLRAWDAANDGPLRLDGEWEMYWKQILLPDDFDEELSLPPGQYELLPKLWNNSSIDGRSLGAFGYATYRLTILHPIENPPPRLSLYLSNYLSSYELWVDGILLSQNGKVGKDPETTTHQWLPRLVSFDLIGNDTEIVLLVANFRHRKGGVSVNPKIGNPAQLEREWMADIAVHIFLMGAYFLVGVFFIGVFLFWSEDQSIIYFIVFSLIFSLRYFLIGPRMAVFLFPDLFTFDAALRLEYLTVYLGVPLIVTFVGESFPRIFSRTVLRVFQGISAVCALVVVFMPVNIFTELAVPFTFLMLAISLYGIWVLICAAQQKEEGGRVGLSGLGIGSLLLLVASGEYLGWFPGIRYATEYGIFIFILSQALALARRLVSHFLKATKIKDAALAEKKEAEAASETLKQIHERMVASKYSLEADNLNRTQKLRNAYSELAAVNQELDQFLYRYSHDLRSPITTLLGLNEVAETSITETAAQKLFGHVKLTVVKMDVLVRKLMKLHEINTQQVDTPEPLSIAVMIHEILDQYATPLGTHRVHVICKVDHIPLILARRPMLQIVLENTIENALYYYNPEREDRVIEVLATIESASLILTIRDNGMGISEEVLPYIYDMFYRGTTRSPGSGLGLYLAKKAIEKLDGALAVISAENEFTEVRIHVPIQVLD